MVLNNWLLIDTILFCCRLFVLFTVHSEEGNGAPFHILAYDKKIPLDMILKSALVQDSYRTVSFVVQFAMDPHKTNS